MKVDVEFIWALYRKKKLQFDIVVGWNKKQIQNIII